MAEPCKQEGAIGEIRATLKFFQDIESRREQREERLAVALEKVASQGAVQGEAIKSVTLVVEKHDKAFANVFARLREIEMKKDDEHKVELKVEHKPEEKKEDMGLLLRILNSKAGIWIAIMVLVGFAIDCITHYDLVLMIKKIFI